VPVDHYENFPVASVLCPPALRPAVVAIYHFARTADDIADEGDATAAQRLGDLAAYRSDLVLALADQPPSPRWAPVFTALAQRVRQFKLPAAPLHDLLDAFEQDVRNPPYPDRAALLDYCRRSANPIGRLLLHLYNINTTKRLRQADAVCSALQLINFWQDLGVDAPRGRCYVPLDALAAHGVTSNELAARADSPRARALVKSLCDWAQALMQEGAPLALAVPGRAGWELRLVVQGGLRILEKIRQMDHATLSRRPTLSARDAPLLLWRALRMGHNAKPGHSKLAP
jgi:hydroxysqualene synthase